MSGIKYEVLAGDDLISALRGGRTGDLLDDAAYAAADEIESLRSRLSEADELHAKQLAETIERLNDDYRSRLAEAELSRDSWKREAELNQAAADECASYAARATEAEALLRDIYSYAEDQGMETLMDMIDSADSADAAQIVTISEHLDESVNHGWVIEGAWSHVQTPDYWVGSSAWSQDHNRALRFARKQDAEQAAAMMLDGIRVRFCEHAWTARE